MKFELSFQSPVPENFLADLGIFVSVDEHVNPVTGLNYNGSSKSSNALEYFVECRKIPKGYCVKRCQWGFFVADAYVDEHSSISQTGAKLAGRPTLILTLDMYSLAYA